MSDMSEFEFKQEVIERLTTIEQIVKNQEEKQNLSREKSNDNRRRIYALEKLNYNLVENCPHTPVIERYKKEQVSSKAVKRYINKAIALTAAIVSIAAAIIGLILKIL